MIVKQSSLIGQYKESLYSFRIYLPQLNTSSTELFGLTECIISSFYEVTDFFSTLILGQTQTSRQRQAPVSTRKPP
jgi:hypothetical protein